MSKHFVSLPISRITLKRNGPNGPYGPAMNSFFSMPFEMCIRDSSNGETDYSNVKNILNTDTKSEYATLATNYTTADGKMYFLPRTASAWILVFMGPPPDIWSIF